MTVYANRTTIGFMDTVAYTPGEPVEVRDASGVWHRVTARSNVFRNDAHVSPGVRPWLVVQVDHDRFDYSVNWPADHVRKLGQ